MDFGIAHPSDSTNSTPNSSVTGSLQYMAPEQLELKPVDSRSDLYSLGLLLYEMYCGFRAFHASSFEELIQKRKANEFSPLGSFGIDISVKARVIVKKLMEIDPEDRFQSADELMEELQKIYRKATDLRPETVISRFLEGDRLLFEKRKSLKKILIPFLLVPCILLIALYLFVNRNHSNSSLTIKTAPSVTNLPAVESKPLQVQKNKSEEAVFSPRASGSSPVLSKTPVPQIRKPRIKKDNIPVSPPSYAKKIEPAVASAAKSKQITPASILDRIRVLVETGDLNSAERMIHKFPLDDGEYHLISAEILLKRNKLNTAISEVEKASRIPADRISSVEMRSKFLYLKACILAEEYDQSSQKQSGQSAMEAWYEVKYNYRSNKTHPHYIKADMEIRRISSSMQ